MMHMLQTRIAARGNALTFGGAADWPLSTAWEEERGWFYADKMDNDYQHSVAYSGCVRTLWGDSKWSWCVIAGLLHGERCEDLPTAEGEHPSFVGAINAASIAIAQIVARRRRGEVIGPEGWREPAALSGAERAASFRARLRKARGQ